MTSTNEYQMTLGETLLDDLFTIGEFLWNALYAIFCVICIVAVAVFQIAFLVAEILFARDCIQWTLGTGKYSGK